MRGRACVDGGARVVLMMMQVKKRLCLIFRDEIIY